MSLLFPSKKAVILDVPEVKNLKSEFVYNFFRKDERTVSSLNIFNKNKGIDIPGSSNNTVLPDISDLRFLPRYVKITFSPPISKDAIENRFDIRSNLKNGKIQNEAVFSNNSFFGVTFQDSLFDEKIKQIVSGSVSKRISAINRLNEERIDVRKKKIFDSIVNINSSIDVTKALIQNGDKSFDDEKIIELIKEIDNLNLQFVDNDTQQNIIDETNIDVKNVRVNVQLNNKIVGSVIKNVVDDPFSQYSNEFSDFVETTRKIQDSSKNTLNSNILSQDEYEGVFEALDEKIIENKDFFSETSVVGYIIEKYENRNNGLKPIKHNPIVLQGQSLSSFFDTDIVYGSEYYYTVRTVALLKVKTTTDQLDNNVIASGLVASKKSVISSVKCIDEISPPPPADFNIRWNFDKYMLALMWVLPVNPQRDIKKFQVFKRKTVNEPFELLKQIDFDDSDVKIKGIENINKKLVLTVNDPLMLYYDEGFKKDNEAIYALASVDAHGLTSNYSMQLHVKFNRFKNNIEKKVISIGGAPKPFPNLYVDNDLFIDTIKSTRKDEIEVFFNPDTISVFNEKEENIDFLTVKETTSNIPSIKNRGNYVLQIINLDSQKDKKIEIFVNDKRK